MTFCLKITAAPLGVVCLGGPAAQLQGKVKQFPKGGCFVYSWHSTTLTAGMKHIQASTMKSKMKALKLGVSAAA